MKDGFIRVAAATPDIKVADPVYNEAQVWNMIEEGEKNGAKLMVFPELCLTGYTCGDLFHQDILVDTAADMLKKLIRRSEGPDVLFFVGLPWMKATLRRGRMCRSPWNGTEGSFPLEAGSCCGA